MMQPNCDLQQPRNKTQKKTLTESLQIGSKITFTRNKYVFKGVVVLLKEQSVIVELDKKTADFLDYATNYTVVNYKNLELINNQVRELIRA